MPPRGGPEGSPPRHRALKLLLFIVPRRYDTSHHAGGPTQSATGLSASSIRVGRESNSVWGESSGCSKTNKPLHLLHSPRQPAGTTSFFHPYSRSAQIGCRCTGMPTTGALLFRSGPGDVSVDTLPNPLLLPNISSPTFVKPSPLRHRAASISVFPQCADFLLLHLRCLRATTGALLRYSETGAVSVDTLPNPLLPSGQLFTFIRQAVAIATPCCQQRRINADRCSCTWDANAGIQHSNYNFNQTVGSSDSSFRACRAYQNNTSSFTCSTRVVSQQAPPPASSHAVRISIAAARGSRRPAPSPPDVRRMETCL